MQQTSKLFLAILGGGVLLGGVLGKMSAPAMQFAAPPDWRDRYRTTYSDTSMQFVDAGPVDLAPPFVWAGMRSGLGDQPYYGPYYQAGENFSDFGTTERDTDLQATAPTLGSEPPATAIEDAAGQAVVAAARLEAMPDIALPADHPAAPNGSQPAPPSTVKTANAL